MPRVEVQFDGVSRGAVNAARQTRAAIAGVGDEGDRTANRIGFMGRVIRYSLVRAAYAGGAGLLALGGAVGFVGFKFDNLKQQAGIAFTTMLGSGQKAQRFLTELQKFAAKTPFEFPDLIRASQRLLAMGFNAKSIVPTLTAVGNAVAGLGGDPVAMDATIRAIGQIQAKGRLMAEEMMQLNEAGTFSWKALAFEIGKSVPEAMALVQKGAITSEIFLEAFARNSERRFGGMMDKQSQTFGGLLSTLKDMFSQFAGTAMKPLFDLATAGMKSIVNANGETTKAANETAHAFGVRLADAVRSVVLYFRRNWPAIKGFLADSAAGARDVAGAIRTVARLANDFSRSIGGWDESFKLILSGLLAAKLAKIGGVLYTLRTAFITTAAVGVASETALAAGAEAAALRIRVAMASTGVGILILIAAEVILHWNKVRRFFVAFGAWLSVWAIKQALKMVEPFSHLPGRFGAWARRAKTRLELEMGKMQDVRDAALRSGEAAGKSWADGFHKNAVPRPQSMGPPGPQGPGAVTGPPSGGGKRGKAAGIAWQASTAGGANTKGFHLPGERTPYDCSAFTQAVYRQAGISIGGNTYSQVKQGTRVARGDLKPGDLIFMNFPGERSPGHVGIFLSWDNGGMMVHDHGASGGVEYQRVPWNAVVDTRTYVSAGGGAAITPPAEGGFDLSGGTAGAKKKTPRGPAKPDPAERKRDVAGLNWLEAQIPKVAPQLRARIRRELDAVAEAVKNAKTEQELAKATSRLEALKKKFNAALLLTGAIAQAKKSARAIAVEIARLPAAMRVDLEARMAAVRDGLAHVVSARSLAKLRRELQRIQHAVANALDKMRQTIDERRDAFGEAFGRLADKALRVFDAKTQDLLDKARATVAEFGFSIGVGEETPTERLLRERREGRDTGDEAARIEDLTRQLIAAQDGEEQARLQKELADAQFDAETRRLEKQAEAERKAADAALEAEKKRIQDERDALREKFTDRLAEIQGKISRGEVTATEAQALIAAAMAEFGIDAKTAGDLIGPAFMATLTAAMTDTTKALKDLIDSIDALNDALGVPGHGRPGGHIPGAQGGPKMQHGGRVPGRYVGREDTVFAHLTPGEEVIDRSLSKALRSYLAGGGRPMGPIADRIYVLGTTEREVAAALAKLIETPQAEKISYRIER